MENLQNPSFFLSNSNVVSCKAVQLYWLFFKARERKRGGGGEEGGRERACERESGKVGGRE